MAKKVSRLSSTSNFDTDIHISSFLFVRIQQNSRYYSSTLSRDKAKTWQQSLNHYVEVSYTFLGIELTK
jgi:hypothetical protein